MQLKSCLAIALVAGSVTSAALAQTQPVGRHFPGQVLSVTQGNTTLYPPFQSGSSDATVTAYDNFPSDSTGLPNGGLYYYAFNGTTGVGGFFGDIAESYHLTVGPGMGGIPINGLSRFEVTCCTAAGLPAGFDVDVVMTFWDSFTGPNCPQLVTQIGTPVALHFAFATALTQGQGVYMQDPGVTFPTPFVIPTDHFGVSYSIIDHGGAASTNVNWFNKLMITFQGTPQAIGSSDDDFGLDANNNGIFCATEGGGEWWWFGGGTHAANMAVRYTGDDSTLSTHACCLTDNSCQDVISAYCAAIGGTYFATQTCSTHGACTPPASGACCHEDGTCTSETAFACSQLLGLYRGDLTVCGGAATACHPFGYTEDPLVLGIDAGDTLATAAVVDYTSSIPTPHSVGYGLHVKRIHGTLNGVSDGDIYKINVCESSTEQFTASSVQAANQIDTIMAIFDKNGAARAYDDDTGTGTTTTSSGSTLSNAFLAAPPNRNGAYYLAIAQWQHVPTDASAALIWNAQNNGATYFPEWAPNGPATNAGAIPNPILGGWTGTNTTTGNYTILLTGACFQGCYANCDQSTTPPVLNANDFQCFLNSFAGQTTGGNGFGYANCDDSTQAPVLNANDFQCFLNAFGAGCPS